MKPYCSAIIPNRGVLSLAQVGWRDLAWTSHPQIEKHFFLQHNLYAISILFIASTNKHSICISKSSEFEARLFSRLNLIVVSLSCQRPSANLSED